MRSGAAVSLPLALVALALVYGGAWGPPPPAPAPAAAAGDLAAAPRNATANTCEPAAAPPPGAAELARVAADALGMLLHAYDGYVAHALPADELRPRSCGGRDTQGGVALTLLDALEALALTNQTARLRWAVGWLAERAPPAVPYGQAHPGGGGGDPGPGCAGGGAGAGGAAAPRSLWDGARAPAHVFETTIRALGGLLSAHALVAAAPEACLGPGAAYRGELLALAEDLGRRLLPAFDTPTGLPAPHVDLAAAAPRAGCAAGGAAANASAAAAAAAQRGGRVTCTACAGTLVLEFGALSALTGRPEYALAARRAAAALAARRHGRTRLVGATLDVDTGRWARADASVGAGADSYYEYLLKGYLAFGDEGLLAAWADAYAAAATRLALPPAAWGGAGALGDAHMAGAGARPAHAHGWALAAFWPGLAALAGRHAAAAAGWRRWAAAWRRYDGLPEAFDLRAGGEGAGGAEKAEALPHRGAHAAMRGYPLRPELAESTFLLGALGAGDGVLGPEQAGALAAAARDVVGTLARRTRARCGHAALLDVATGEQDDSMESFFISETAKYAWLAATPAAAGLVDHYVLTTEGHPLPVFAAGGPGFGPPLASLAGAVEGGGGGGAAGIAEDVRDDDDDEPAGAAAAAAAQCAPVCAPAGGARRAAARAAALAAAAPALAPGARARGAALLRARRCAACAATARALGRAQRARAAALAALAAAAAGEPPPRAGAAGAAAAADALLELPRYFMCALEPREGAPEPGPAEQAQELEQGQPPGEAPPDEAPPERQPPAAGARLACGAFRELPPPHVPGALEGLPPNALVLQVSAAGGGAGERGSPAERRQAWTRAHEARRQASRRARRRLAAADDEVAVALTAPGAAGSSANATFTALLARFGAELVPGCARGDAERAARALRAWAAWRRRAAGGGGAAAAAGEQPTREDSGAEDDGGGAEEDPYCDPDDVDEGSGECRPASEEEEEEVEAEGAGEQQQQTCENPDAAAPAPAPAPPPPRAAACDVEGALVAASPPDGCALAPGAAAAAAGAVVLARRGGCAFAQKAAAAAAAGAAAVVVINTAAAGGEGGSGLVSMRAPAGGGPGPPIVAVAVRAADGAALLAAAAAGGARARLAAPPRVRWEALPGGAAAPAAKQAAERQDAAAAAAEGGRLAPPRVDVLVPAGSEAWVLPRLRAGGVDGAAVVAALAREFGRQAAAAAAAADAMLEEAP